MNGFQVEGTTLVKYTGKVVDVIIPDGITTIGEGAFSNSTVRKAFIPDSVRQLNVRAFENCKCLEQISLPPNLCVGRECFLGCHNLRNIEPRGLLPIVQCQAFQSTHWYREQPPGLIVLGDCLIEAKGENDRELFIPEGIHTIADFAFCNALRQEESLRSIRLPDSLVRIGVRSFSDHLELREVHLGKNLFVIGLGAFLNCHQLQRLFPPATGFESKHILVERLAFPKDLIESGGLPEEFFFV